MKPTVSVIVPCFNSGETVEKTLDSLVNQTLRDIELILIDDGSTDNTFDILQRYKNDYPDIQINIYQKENEGIAEARNFGVAKATGEYIGFLDSDDYAEADMYKEMYNKAINEDLDMVVSNFYWENSKGSTLQKEGPYELGPDMMVNLFAVLWNKIYKNTWIRGLDVSFPYGKRYEDAYYLYCLTMHTRNIGFIDKAYVHYYQHSGSITHTNNEQVKNMIDVFSQIVKYYKEHYQFDKYKDALEYIHVRFFLGNSFLRSARIEDKEDRKNTIMMGWNLLNSEFPDWRKNKYLRSIGGLKNKYYRIVNDGNIMFFAWLFRTFKKENI